MEGSCMHPHCPVQGLELRGEAGMGEKRKRRKAELPIKKKVQSDL